MRRQATSYLSIAFVLAMLTACSSSGTNDPPTFADAAPDTSTSTTAGTTTSIPTPATAPVVEVTGQQFCVIESGGSWSGPALTESRLPGSTQSDYVLSCTGPASDARAAVDWLNTINCDFAFDGHTTVGNCIGTTVGANDGGGWDGTFVATTTWSKTNPAHMHVIDATTAGTGGYEGLTYEFRVEGAADPWTIIGTIEPTE